MWSTYLTRLQIVEQEERTLQGLLASSLQSDQLHDVLLTYYSYLDEHSPGFTKLPLGSQGSVEGVLIMLIPAHKPSH